MGFFGKRHNKTTLLNLDVGGGDKEALQGRMKDLQADMDRVKQRHEAEMEMLNKRMVSIVAKVQTAKTPTRKKSLPTPPPPPGPPPGPLPSRRHSRGRVSSFNSNMSQSSNLSRQRSKQYHHTRHNYQLPQPIQSTPPVSEISIATASIGSACGNASMKTRNNTDEASQDNSYASHISWKNGRKVRTVYRTVRAIESDTVSATGSQTSRRSNTSAPTREIRVHHSSSRPRSSQQHSHAPSSSSERSGISVRNYPPPDNTPTGSNTKTLRGRVFTDSSHKERVPRRSDGGRRDGDYERVNDDAFMVKKKWTPSEPSQSLLSNLKNTDDKRTAFDNNTEMKPSKSRGTRGTLKSISDESDITNSYDPSSYATNNQRERMRNNNDASNYSSTDRTCRTSTHPRRSSRSHDNDHSRVRRSVNSPMEVRDDGIQNTGIYFATKQEQCRRSGQIRNAAVPRSVYPPTCSDQAVNLMESIRAGVKLKPVSECMSSESPPSTEGGLMSEILAQIQAKKKRILAEENGEVDW